MLSETAVENLSLALLKRQQEINNFVVHKIAERVKEIGTMLPSDIYKLERLLKTGSDVKLINKELSRLTGLQEKEIKRIIKEVAQTHYKDAKPFFDYRHKSYIPFEENKPLQRVIKAIQEQTVEGYENLIRAQAFMIRDLKNPKRLIPTSISKTYYSVVDEAIQANQQGVIDYHTAMRRTLKQLNDSGIRSVTYHPESGRVYTQRLDTAVRRNILDGVRAISQAVQDEVGEEFGADGKEITVHANSAPDHEPIQGHQFSNEEYEKLQNAEAFTDYNGKHFEPIQRAIGTLNCRHFTYSIVLGVTKPNYTQEQLDEMIAKNNKGYTTKDGKHYTMYECTQKQREMETKVRWAKDGQMMAQTAGDLQLAQKYDADIDKYTKEYIAFSNACGLKPKMQKMVVEGYKKLK